MSLQTKLLTIVICFLCSFASAQTVLASNPQALTLVAQSMAAMTGGNPVSDLTMSANVTHIAGSDTETGTAVMLALRSSIMRQVQYTALRNNSRAKQWKLYAI
jgi:hypothetical protein